MPVQGYVSIVLHAHLPFIRHPEYPDYLEEDWLYEAITETYVPLLRMMDRLTRDNVPFRLTMSLTPPLCEMLVDPLLQQRYLKRLEGLVALALEQQEARKDTSFSSVAAFYAWDLGNILHHYRDLWGCQLLPQFRRFQDLGCLEIITCGATHGFLPLMATDESRQAQIQVAVKNYEKHFGRPPRGIWLPECAFAPGLDLLLAQAGIRYFFVETHGLLNGTPRPRFGVHQPIYTPAGVAVFGRDKETSEQVWSAEQGYPGDPLYREFYRDLGYDLPYALVRPYLHADGIRRNIGLKYHRITGKVALGEKEPYVPAWALERAETHAENFLRNRVAQCRHLKQTMGMVPHLTAPYDAELFGHWWFEGPHFLEMFFRKAIFDQDEIRVVTPSEYLSLSPVHEEATPSLSSWGANGYFKVWLNGTNDWIYRHLHRAEERMVQAVMQHPDATGLVRRALTQAGRELLLAQASDWAFIMTMDTTVPYAEKRTRDHLAAFFQLMDQVESGQVDEARLYDLEWRNSIFQELDYLAWHPQQAPVRGAGSAVSTLL